jgi:hypothetical protein
VFVSQSQRQITVMAKKQEKKNPQDNTVVYAVLGIGGYLLFQLLNSGVGQQAVQVAQQCCGR